MSCLNKQATHEIEILQTISIAAKKFADGGKTKVNLGDLVAAAMKWRPSKLSSGTWFGLARYYIGFLENGVLDLIDDLREFNTNSVDPRQICASISFSEVIANEPALKMCPQVQHYLVCTKYTKEKVRAQAQGAPKAEFLEVARPIQMLKKPKM